MKHVVSIRQLMRPLLHNHWKSWPQTRYAFMTKNETRTIVGVSVLLITYGLLSLSQAFPPREAKVTDGEDARMYQRAIERMHVGENYYQIVGEELRTRGYALRPFFNWRLPTIAWAIGHLPSVEWGRWALAILAFLTLLLWFQVLDREVGFSFAVAGALLLCGPLLLCLSEKGVYYHELWAGVLIALSLAAHALGHKIVSIIVGVLAVFIRELALPYVLIMLIVALWEKHNREVLGWFGGVIIFSLFLGYHAFLVSGLLTPLDIENESWIQFGGWHFVLSTGVWNILLLVAPKWIVAIVLPLALIGVVGWRGASGVRVSLVLGVYFCAYLIAGRVDNTYWGLMYAPLIPLGFLYAIPSLIDLTKRLLWGHSHMSVP